MTAVNNTSPFDQERLDAISDMLVTQVERDSARSIRPHRLALLVSLIVAAVLISTGGTALALTGHLPFVEPPPPPVATATVTPTPPETPSPSPTPTPTTPPEPPATTLNGFDIESIYAACEAALPAGTWPSGVPLPTPRPEMNDFGLASENGFTVDRAHGDPNAIFVDVAYQLDETDYGSDLCVASGDPAHPRVEFIQSFD
ncbi:hypothetical protein ACPPVQ_13895 [Diaminobutyricibacter sp. McL0618]|uniref:hypothetical protein n=1 Tax=Leifsonia sp. McL0618 TaxID=3415677 RepID=UPI003CFB4150